MMSAMDIDTFWSLVDRSRAAHPDNEIAQADFLTDLVLQLPQDQALTFAAIFEAQDTRATRWDIWGAGYVLNEGMSDDSFKDFKGWLIAQGRDVFEAALADPDSLVDVPGVVPGDTHGAETF